MNNIEKARFDIDEAVDRWLELNGLTREHTLRLDFSRLDEELDNLLTEGEQLFAE